MSSYVYVVAEIGMRYETAEPAGMNDHAAGQRSRSLFPGCCVAKHARQHSTQITSTSRLGRNTRQHDQSMIRRHERAWQKVTKATESQLNKPYIYVLMCTIPETRESAAAASRKTQQQHPAKRSSSTLKLTHHNVARPTLLAYYY